MPPAAGRVLSPGSIKDRGRLEMHEISGFNENDIGDVWWAELAARLLHPVQVEIIEALRWINRPLSPADLLRILGGKRVGLRIEYHLRRLARLDALALADDAKARSHVYRLVGRSGQ